MGMGYCFLVHLIYGSENLGNLCGLVVKYLAVTANAKHQRYKIC